MNVKLEAIELDKTIQCRAELNTGLVNEYADALVAGDSFPPVILFGTPQKSWIGDGWHRVLAAEQIGAKTVRAEIRKGGRSDALRFALSANAIHGQRRTNADKRRSVELALAEWPRLSDRKIAEICAVGHDMVADVRQNQLAENASSPPPPRIGRDGKERNLPKPREPDQPAPTEDDAPHVTAGPSLRPIGPPRNGLDFARMAILDLEQIKPDDAERQEAFCLVKTWIQDNE